MGCGVSKSRAAPNPGTSSGETIASPESPCLAPRPSWLPLQGKGMANVDPHCWSLTVEQWIFFVRACVDTDAWKNLAKDKGEYNITMYDVNDHFVKPWTRGTGCSVALLLNPDPGPVELMISHAWGGSVVETYNCLQNLVNHTEVPSTARIFFCTFCMYQPEDNAPGGLTIGEQLQHAPFAKVIESKPQYGMFVIHTTIYEVYARMWTVHEIDEATECKVLAQGLFDFYRWDKDKFNAAKAIKTDASDCRPDDREMLVKLIDGRGGFQRLDGVIAKFRQLMLDKLEKDLNKKIKKTHHLVNTQAHFDWYRTERGYYGGFGAGLCQDMGVSVQWGLGRDPGDFATRWTEALERVSHSLGIEHASVRKMRAAYPLGRQSYPFGE
eukprot:TRINITY_DN93628_c0_g1_i1.p1 TRINITY_DN93628_c0_g1~~TRINITY_DN93628_c0_g1_i1.p1  ORF type:complete len:382 (-),score=39.49 TRINITY_DN93628_c0_g1_i1:59-1204(-)